MRNPISEQSRSKVLNYFIVIIISIVGIYRQDFTLQKTTMFEQLMVQIFAPLQSGTTSVKRNVSTFIDNYFKLVDTNRQNDEYRKIIKDLNSRIFQLENVRLENSRLKALLQFGKEIPKEKVLAQVIAWDASNEFKVLRINKGESDGIQLRSPVITSNGLVGYVVRIYSNYADVLTILDQNNRVDAIVRRTRSHGVVEGVSEFKCRMKYVVRTEPVVVDDVIVTAGLGNIYPKGIKVGTITEIEKQSYGLTQSIQVTPSVDFHRLEEVVVLLPLANPITKVSTQTKEELLENGSSQGSDDE